MSLIFCKRNRDKIRDDIIAKSYGEKNATQFWAEIKKRTKQLDSAPADVDGVKGNQNIADLFYGKFSSIFGRSNFDALPHLSNSNLFNSRLPTSVITNAITQLNTCLGFDGIHTNHLRYSSLLMKFFFRQFFNSCFIHNHFPDKLLSGVIRPSVMDRSGNFKSSSNYREIMISSNFMKILEYIILPFIRKIPVNPTQFSYRKNTSTILATLILKETIKLYIDNGNCVFSCFLDLSKAFERVEHSILIVKLRDKRVPDFIINILCSIFSNSLAKVYFNGCFSQSWLLRKGTRQGGILSAYLFNTYIDSISSRFSGFSNGCILGINKVNIQAYADDIVLLSPTRQ